MRSVAFTGLFLLFANDFSHAQAPKFQLLDKDVLQGAVVVLRRVDRGTETFKVRFLGREYESFRFGKHRTVLLGIHYQLRPGTHTVLAEYDAGGSTASARFVIRVRELYPKLKYEPPKRSPEDQKRINEEHEKKQETLKDMDLTVSSMTYFVWSVDPVKVNAPFGDKRCRDRIGRKKFNCRYHLGTDYRSAFDIFHQNAQPAHAINSGRVVRTAENLIDGKLVIIDHGNGISSEYLHLSRFLVKEGDMVIRGQKIGITGKTGSTDAIHLHLTVKMDKGKTIVDPEIFLKTLSK